MSFPDVDYSWSPVDSITPLFAALESQSVMILLLFVKFDFSGIVAIRVSYLQFIHTVMLKLNTCLLYFTAAGPGKEWKPKPTHNNIAQGKAISASSADLSTVSAEVDTQPQPTSVSVESKEGTSELQQKLEKSHISEIQHVVIPNHLHVPEAEKLGFCFGSFEASLGLGVSPYNAAENEKTPSLSGTSEDIEETENEHFSRSVIAWSLYSQSLFSPVYDL